MDTHHRIYVTGSTGMVGSAIIRGLKNSGYVHVHGISTQNCDLANQQEVNQKLMQLKPDFIFHCASKVGGILRNIKYPADFGLTNSFINNNVINWAHHTGAKLLFLGSSCCYPAHCPQPMKEEYIMTGPCEPTNEMYALSKIYGMKLCQAYRQQYGCNFIVGQPSNVYGLGDNFDLDHGHVVAALINKYHNAKVNDTSVTNWGDGSAQRELLYVDDLASASIFLMNEYNGDQPINIGTGLDISIKELAEKISDITQFSGNVIWDQTKPAGMKRKVLDVSKIHQLGWKHKINLDEGLRRTYQWYLNHQKSNTH